MTQQLSTYKINLIFKTLAQLNPEPRTELNYATPFQLLIAVMLSAQSTDIGVNKATKPLFQQAPDAYALYALGEANIRKAIKTIGLYNTKAKNAYRIAEQLITNQSINNHLGEVPQSRAQLEALPGVGRKTANVILNTAFGQPTMAVDTHIFRVANRTGIAPGKNVLQVETHLLANIPKKYLIDAHHWLILHGRYTCKARTPLCSQCPIAKWCNWDSKG